MRIGWQHEKCIFCLKKANLTVEHLIPEALGGRLTARFLCGFCNSNFGKGFEASARFDPTIQLALERLSTKNPELFAKLREGQRVILKGPGGNQSGKIIRGTAEVASQRQPDGSLIQPTEIARQNIQNMLRRDGLKPSEIEVALTLFDAAPVNERIEISSNIDVINWSSESASLDFSKSNLMHPLVPAKIAYEFLAGHLGDQIYSAAPHFESIRSMFAAGILSEEVASVARLHAENERVFHGICFLGNEPYATVLIRLFTQLAFRVSFKQIAVGGPRFIYTHFLENGEENMRLLGDSQ